MNVSVQILLRIPEEVEHLMDGRRILKESVQETIRHAETTGEKFIDPSTGRSLASFRPGKVTYWVEYGNSHAEYEIHAVYSHKMELRRRSASERPKSGGDGGSGWTCNQCKVPVQAMLVLVQYLSTDLAVDLPACPQCGMVLIDEGLATGKMAEVEKILEDK